MAGSIAQAPPSEPIGTRDIDSTPPAMISWSQPERTFWAAVLTASSPEAQNRLSWSPATVSGRPAARAAVREITEPWSPTGETTPRTTSSIRVDVEGGVPLAQLVDQPDDEVDRLGAVQRPATVATARGADGVVDEGLGGHRVPFSGCAGGLGSSSRHEGRGGNRGRVSRTTASNEALRSSRTSSRVSVRARSHSRTAAFTSPA